MLTPWKESYDQSRQHIIKQRHYFANKSPSSQGYGFSSSHIWMWVLDNKESWAPKNWCFWTAVLEKTLESSLDCKEYNQSILKEISPCNEHGGLNSFRMDWLDLLAVQMTLKSLLQHRSLKASVFWRTVFFMIQLLHPYMTTGKTTVLTVLTRQTFVSKGKSLLFNMLSRFVIAFLPRRKHLFYFMFAITILNDFGAQENNIYTSKLLLSCWGSCWGSQILTHRKYFLGTWKRQQEPEPVWDTPSAKDA